jgi:hypothetical protein
MRCSRRNIYVGDPIITPVSDKEAGAFLVQDMNDKAAFIPMVYECNAYALALVSAAKKYFATNYYIIPAIGMVWLKSNAKRPAHAVNFYVTPEELIRYIEPQTDHRYFPDQRIVFVYI